MRYEDGVTLLRVDGDVRAPATFGFADLAALDGQVDDVGTVVPRRIGGAVRLDAILAAVGPDPRATELILTSSDGGFSQSVERSSAAGAVLVYRLGDDPLPEAEGGPVRFFIPGGADRCANVKALAHIRVAIPR